MVESTGNTSLEGSTTRRHIAIIGAGLAGISMLSGIVRAAVDEGMKDIDITLFEKAKKPATGLAYQTDLPDAFMLNHEFNYMGSVNVLKDKSDDADFFQWVNHHINTLQPLYPHYDLTKLDSYVPRNLYGRYLDARYEEILCYAKEQGIPIALENLAVENVKEKDRGFSIITSNDNTKNEKHFDRVILATGNWFKDINPTLKSTGRAFLSQQWKEYLHNDTIPEQATMLITGTGLSAYDSALAALDSGKYKEVIMASRGGNLRRVRGNTEDYHRKYLTLKNLDTLAGGVEAPIKLEDIFYLLNKELEHAYGNPVIWKEAYTVPEIIEQFKNDMNQVENNETLKWRSVYAAIPDSERHEIYHRLCEEDKEIFQTKYASLWACFHAPMPIYNAKKINDYMEKGQIKLINGAQFPNFNTETGKFELIYAQKEDGTPLIHNDPAEPIPERYIRKVSADVYIDAMGMAKNINKVPLYHNLIQNGLAEVHPRGGIRADLTTRLLKVGDITKKGIYAIGQNTNGETILTHNSLQISELGVTIGRDIVKSLKAERIQENAKPYVGMSR